MKEVLLLTPGTLLDMFAAASPRKDPKREQWEEGDD